MRVAVLVCVGATACGPGLAHVDARSVGREALLDASGNAEAIENLFRGSVVDGGLWFDDSACSAQFSNGGGHPAAPEGTAFFGRYLEVSPHSRLVWTNDESGNAGQLSTLMLEDHGDTTRIVLHELYPSAEAFEAAKGSYDGMPESFGQLDALLAG